MLPTSVRRVVSAATPQSSTALLSSGIRASSCVTLSGRAVGHQRRYSSSKPSSPDNGEPKNIATSDSVTASSSGESKSSKTKAAGERRKKKAKDASASLATRLPVVPSTQHLSQEALGLSTFFSLHRPISVTHSFPKTVSDESFAAIFGPSLRSSKTSDVISTLSNTVDQLEQPMSKLNLESQQQELDTSDGPTRIDLKHPDGSESSVYVQVNAMSGQFLPFRPPPAPQSASATAPAVTADSSAAEEVEADRDGPSHRVYRAVLTIEETTDADGQVKIIAHSPEIIEESDGHHRQQQEQAPAPRTFLERMALRQLRFDAALAQRHLDNSGMHAISVRRQKKLKMKKKKYKKLMKRTRNLRRKLDRL
ncbi:hypothetical protein VTK73DRAFT_6533 [Phialemonium thermophilum]|uniref:Small ribosomal subunit protein mS38 n=1 Tax=Phialemonium thermophilum TaxID=223376 RepID=A0ABR3XVA8_9PEZI